MGNMLQARYYHYKRGKVISHSKRSGPKNRCYNCDKPLVGVYRRRGNPEDGKQWVKIAEYCDRCDIFFPIDGSFDVYPRMDNKAWVKSLGPEDEFE
jgi:hypothetical protein